MLSWLHRYLPAFAGFAAGVFGLATIGSAMSASLNPSNAPGIFTWLMIIIASVCFGIISFSLVEFKNSRVTRDSTDCIDSCAYVVTSERNLYNELYLTDRSIVKSATSYIRASGSRSRDNSYLQSIETALRDNGKLGYIRILLGSPKTIEIVDHLSRIANIMEQRQGGDGRKSIEIALYDDGHSLGEKFISCSESKVFVALPSFASPQGYDTALVVENKQVAKQVGDLLATMFETAPRKFVTAKELREAVNGWKANVAVS